MTKSAATTTVPVSLDWPSHAWQGAFWKVVSCLCFAGINGIVRYWSGGMPDPNIDTLPVNVLMFFQNVFGTLFLLPLILKSGLSELKTKYPGLHLIRVASAIAGIYLWYLTLQTMPIAEGVALSFTGPIFTVLGAWLLLHEKIGLQRLMAILLSLLGAYIISRPDVPLRGGMHQVGFYALLPLSSAIILAGNKLLTRRLAKLGETPTTLATFLLVFMAPVSLIPALFEWTMPHSVHWPWLVFMGALTAGAHISFSKAYQLAEVTFLTPVGFTKFFFSTMVGYFAFSELPTSWTVWIGTAIIFTSILLLAYKISLYSWAKRFKSN